MSLVSIAAIYFVVWWVVLFAVLPFGIKSAHEADTGVEPGHDAGAPVRILLLRKFLITTIVSAVLFGAALLVIKSGLLGLDDVLFLNTAPGID